MKKIDHWNYRVLKTKLPTGEFDYTIHEVFYNKDGKIWGYTGAKEPYSDTKKGLKWCLNKMQIALKKPVLTPEKIEKNLAKPDFDIPDFNKLDKKEKKKCKK